MASFQTLWEHENGNMYPGPHFRRANWLLYEATEPESSFRLPLPAEEAGDPALPLPGPLSPAAEEAADTISQGGWLSDQTQDPAAAEGPRCERMARPSHERQHRERPHSSWSADTPDRTRPSSRAFSRHFGLAFLNKGPLTPRLTERLSTSLDGDPHDRHTDL
ncbi:hypothetical protein [Actinomadura chokoriensis]|uniref:Uncharacterized protein n=1 Tax=Actinomadura chokoriensis TaxID=454156 RepID=A0ABV4QW89_9ACTN